MITQIAPLLAMWLLLAVLCRLQVCVHTSAIVIVQECGSNHVVSLWGRTDHGFGACPEMVDNKQSFAVTRLQIQMDTYPTWYEFTRLGKGSPTCRSH